MLTKKRYSVTDIMLWNYRAVIGLSIYSFLITYFYVKLEFHFIHLPLTAVALLGVALAFSLALQNNAAYGRTWEARKSWSDITSFSRAWGMKVQALVHSEQNKVSRDQLKDVHRVLVHRHIAWLTALRHALREPRPWEAFRESQMLGKWQKKLHTPEAVNTLQHDLTSYIPMSELDYVMLKNNKATTVLYLQSRHLRKLKEEGLIKDAAFLDLENLLQNFLALQGKSERIKNFPYPRQLVSIHCLFLWMFLLFLPIALVPQFTEISRALTGGTLVHGSPFVWIAVPFSVMISWFFHSLESLGRAGENPFAGSPNDVPISTIARDVEIDLIQQFNEDSNKEPEQFPEAPHVQM